MKKSKKSQIEKIDKQIAKLKKESESIENKIREEMQIKILSDLGKKFGIFELTERNNAKKFIGQTKDILNASEKDINAIENEINRVKNELKKLHDNKEKEMKEYLFKMNEMKAELEKFQLVTNKGPKNKH